MKKIGLLLALFVASISITQASNADLFSYDNEEISQEFADLNALESYVLTNQEVTYDQLLSTNELSNFNLNTNNFSGVTSPMFSFADIDWGSFAWGFCCWPVGFFTVLLNSNKDSDQKLSFWIGLGTNVILGVIGRIGVY